jgi:hypothetical protein
MSRRFQFSLKWLFVAMLVVAAFFGGMVLQRQVDKPAYHRVPIGYGDTEAVTLPDGTTWIRHE